MTELTAYVKDDLVPARHLTGTVDGQPYEYLEVNGCNCDILRSYSRAVLEFKGKAYVFSGWNSDQGVAYFKPVRVGEVAGWRRRLIAALPSLLLFAQGPGRRAGSEAWLRIHHSRSRLR